MMRTDSPEANRFIDHVMHAGIPRGRDAKRAVHAALVTLGELLDESETNRIAPCLPQTLAPWLRIHAFDRGADASSFFSRVAHAESVPQSQAREHAQIVCGVIARTLPQPVRDLLSKRLPPPLSELFEVAASSEPPPHPHHAGPSHHVLATGESGSSHPISESPPPIATHAVGEQNTTKLSTARGLTQDVASETLATAHPADDRTISKVSG